MKKLWKKTAVIFMIIPVLMMSLMAQPASTEAAEDLGLHVDAAILIDADTGQILYEQNAESPLGIASMSKMMTEYLLFEAIKDGKVTWDQEYTVTDYTYKVSQDRALSNVPLRLGEKYTIRELYEALAIYSANAATIGIAETIAGSETKFVKMMNDKASELGLEGYTFVNSTGLNNSHLHGMHPEGTGEKDENVMPAKSVALLAYRLLKDYPEVLDTTSIPTKVFREGTDDAIKMDNWNFMLPGFVYAYDGVDGLKTGTTEFAGHCFTGTAKRGDTRLIAVVMKAVDEKGNGSYKARFDAAKALFEYGFNQFSEEELLSAGHQFKGNETVPVKKGKEKTVKAGVENPFKMLVKTTDKDEYGVEFAKGDSKSLEAPVKKGTVVGKANIVRKDGGELYGFIEGGQLSADVVTLDSVEKAGWFKLTLQAIGDFFSGVWNKSTDFVKGLF
ncbi:serine hydrolase [Edaphobacillus lindanitolerans]|uniref:serine-type D-Ala-D-Ala carboxypeptidase n=1 Tax=Edaphobacillus lindanitolerans TaxID=550447 RepID=A0A1U7PTN9_9BACI|nr:serine hydrolase [Edaphobacillus lindanitolerans]SIT93483.1 D-alanyl-D-alanine carboxypeptidase (penicillin-binding protein 5/6) [Edaphobacillus lindanitolerans]